MKEGQEVTVNGNIYVTFKTDKQSCEDCIASNNETLCEAINEPEERCVTQTYDPNFVIFKLKDND